MRSLGKRSGSARNFDLWLQLQRDSAAIDRLYDYWILGEGASRKHARWSIVRDVLGWVD